MEGQQEIRETLFEILGEQGCGITCEDDVSIFARDARLETHALRVYGAMEPWNDGR